MKNNLVSSKFHQICQTGFFVILLLPIIFFQPWFYPPDFPKTIIFRGILAILLFLLAWQVLYKKIAFSWQDLKKNKVIWALGALLCVYALATIFSVDRYFSLWGNPYRGGGFVTFAFYFAFAILAFMMLKKEDWKKARIFSVGVAILVSLIAVFQYYGWLAMWFAPTQNGPPSTMGNPILLAIYLLLLFFPTLSFCLEEKNKYIKTFYAIASAIFVFTILITGVRAAYLGFIVGIIYFLLWYPKKFKFLKMCLGTFLLLVFLVVLGANIHPALPKILQNRITKGLVGSLSINRAINDGRYPAWQIALKEIEDKPVLGWGPENLSVGFDKFYDPKITSSPWWDKAHNIFLQTGAETGILGIMAYISLFVVLFWQLQKTKQKNGDENTSLAIHGIQATLVGYLVANFFSFDSFATYLIFFLLVGYSLHIMYGSVQTTAHDGMQKKASWTTACIWLLFAVLAIFLWQYNIVPFFINEKINEASNLANQKQCDQAFAAMDTILPQHSLLDSYAIMEDVGFEQTCSQDYPQNALTYIQRGLNLMAQGVKIQPLYTRYWFYMGNLETTLAEQEENPATESTSIQQAIYDFNRALQLAPKHQEIIIAKAEAEMDAGDYNSAKNDSQTCIALNPGLADCYWSLALSDIYLQNDQDANANITIAAAKGYNTGSEAGLIDLANAYGQKPDYQNLVIVFKKLITIDPTTAQYHLSLASFYAKLGEYGLARQEAAIALQLSPQSQQNISAFLQTLPQ